MIGEISISGVYIVSLIFLFCAAVVIATILFRVLAITGFYSLVTYRPVVDLALFILVLAALVWATEHWGVRA